MQRIINNPDMVVEDMLKGYVKAHKNLVRATANPRVVASAFPKKPGKVGIVTGGGSGHKPAFIGYVGKNMVDAAAVGEVFSSPTAKAFYEAFVEADAGAGVACLYGNYAGDNMNVKLAAMLADDDIQVRTVVANDDVASAPKDEPLKRRGVAGEVLMWKVGGAKAATGASLNEVAACAQKAVDNTRSIGIGLTPCTIPAVGHPNFQIGPGNMEVGIGHHGEPGVKVTDLATADEMAEMMVEAVAGDMPFAAGDELAVIVSGLGATPIMELYILYNRIEELLAAKGLRVYKPFVGNYFTSLEMMGATFTAMKLDDELKQMLDMPAESMGLTVV